MHKLNSYTKYTTAEDVTEGLDLSGKVAFVTGCTNGIGTETMRVLAQRGAHVLATGRTIKKVESASQGMQGHITPLALELTDLDSVNHCAMSHPSLGHSLRRCAHVFTWASNSPTVPRLVDYMLHVATRKVFYAKCFKGLVTDMPPLCLMYNSLCPLIPPHPSDYFPLLFGTFNSFSSS